MNDYNHVQIVRGTNKDLLLVYLFVLESTVTIMVTASVLGHCGMWHTYRACSRV